MNLQPNKNLSVILETLGFEKLSIETNAIFIMNHIAANNSSGIPLTSL